MLATPAVPQISAMPELAGLGSALPVVVDISPLVLVTFTLLAGIFTAALSVILIYHWRRFPFEHETFRRVESIYKIGVILCLAVAVIGILIS